MNITLRGTEVSDAEDLYVLYSCPKVIAGTLRLPYQSLESMRARLANRSPNDHGIVAVVDGRVIGNAGLHMMPSLRQRHIGSLGMAVHDDFQGQGVGNALMGGLIDLADNWLGLHRLQLEVLTDNEAAIHLYLRHGFEIEGTLRDFVFRHGRFEDAHVMGRFRS